MWVVITFQKVIGSISGTTCGLKPAPPCTLTLRVALCLRLGWRGCIGLKSFILGRRNKWTLRRGCKSKEALTLAFHVAFLMPKMYTPKIDTVFRRSGSILKSDKPSASSVGRMSPCLLQIFPSFRLIFELHWNHLRDVSKGVWRTIPPPRIKDVTNFWLWCESSCSQSRTFVKFSQKQLCMTQMSDIRSSLITCFEIDKLSFKNIYRTKNRIFLHNNFLKIEQPSDWPT